MMESERTERNSKDMKPNKIKKWTQNQENMRAIGKMKENAKYRLENERP